MREIKFRAWDKVVGMKYFDLSDLVGRHLIIYHGVYDVPVMQCTGLQDKNGKEIYEGDIIRSTSNMEEYFDFVKWDSERGTWKFENTQGLCEVTWDDIDQKSAEVIGNKYENPELIEVIA